MEDPLDREGLTHLFTKHNFFLRYVSLEVINSESGSVEMSTVLMSVSIQVAQTPVEALRKPGSSRTQLVSSLQYISDWVDCLLQGLFLPSHHKDSPDNKLRHRLPNFWGQMRCIPLRITRGIAKTRLGQAMLLLRHAYHCGQQSSPAAFPLPKDLWICLAAASGAKCGSLLRSNLAQQRLALHYVQALPFFFPWQKQHNLFHIHLMRRITSMERAS